MKTLVIFIVVIGLLAFGANYGYGWYNDQTTQPASDSSQKVAFKVTRERNEQKFTLRYKGDLKGDTITGKVEVGQGDDTRSFDWEAKRQK